MVDEGSKKEQEAVALNAPATPMNTNLLQGSTDAAVFNSSFAAIVAELNAKLVNKEAYAMELELQMAFMAYKVSSRYLFAICFSLGFCGGFFC